VGGEQETAVEEGRMEGGCLAKLDPCSVWRAPGRLGIGLIVINITGSYCMSVIIYTCFTKLNQSCARPPRVGTRFGFILATILSSPFSFHPLLLQIANRLIISFAVSSFHFCFLTSTGRNIYIHNNEKMFQFFLRI